LERVIAKRQIVKYININNNDSNNMLIYFNQRAPPIALIINDLQNFRPGDFLQTIGYQGFKT